MAIFSKHFGGHGPFGSPVATPIFVNPGVDFRCPHWLESVPFYLHWNSFGGNFRVQWTEISFFYLEQGWANGPSGHFVRPAEQPHVVWYYIFRVYNKVILSIRLEFSRFCFTRFIRNRCFTQPEVTIVKYMGLPVARCNTGVSNTRAACGARGPFVRPAKMFGNIQIINIYVAKCFEKKCCQIIWPKLDHTQRGLRPGRSNFSLSSKFWESLAIRKRCMHTLCGLRKQKTGFLVKSFGERCGSMVLTAACYWRSNLCIPAHKFVSVSA